MSKLKSLEELFGGRHFDREIIILCVRWYLRYKLRLAYSTQREQPFHGKVNRDSTAK
jgi:transposase-like protein